MNTRNILTAIALLSTASSFAAQPIDFGEITPDTEYAYEALTPAGGRFTPTETQVIKTYATGDMLHAYSDAAHTQEIPANRFYFGANGEKVQVYSGTAQQTIYFYNDLPLDGGIFRLAAGSEPITLCQAYPSPDDGVMSLSDNYRLELIFNTPVKCTKCKLEAGDRSLELTPDIYNATVSINWYGIIMQWYEEGVLSEGSDLTMTITGIRDDNDSTNRPDFGDGLGKLILRYKTAAKPSSLVSEHGTPASGTPAMLTYYLPTGDDGLVTLTFDRALDASRLPKAQLQYGDIDNQDFGMYIESLPVIIEGPTLKVDLRGVSRLPGEMVPGLPEQKYIYMQVTDIRSVDGQHVWTGQLASPYTFGFSYELKSVVYDLAADWWPLPGSPLASGTEMEIWVLNGNKISFESVDFSYVKDGNPETASVAYSDLAVSPDPGNADARLFNLAAPAMNPDADTDITVTFGGMLCADGQNHDSDIRVRYKAVAAGVGEVVIPEGEGEIYDLHGRRVANPAPGIYIRDGKKIAIR